MNRKQCTDCKQFLSVHDFFPNKARKDGLQNVCKPCQRIRRTEYNHRHPEEYRAYSHRYKLEHKKELADAQRARNRELRKEMISVYGGKCACPKCPETNPSFLTLDHVNGDGAKHRGKHINKKGVTRYSKSPNAIYMELKRAGWPKNGYQLLCWNCNCASRFNGMCPHLSTTGLDAG